MNTLAVILARSGSVGLKNKHLLDLLGRPVIEYTFAHARSSCRLSQVVVSSDCPHILQLAVSAGFATIRRPSALATSDASVQAVLLHALHEVESRANFRADAIATLYGNVPLRPQGIIDRAIDLLESTRCDSVRSFCPVGKWHPAWMSRIDGDSVVPLQPGSIHSRQDLQPLYLHDGAIVVSSRAALLRGEATPDDPHAFFGIDRRAVLTEAGDTIEIDRPVDLYLAEAIFRSRANSQELRRAS